mmetsp:Transcript_21691/g.64605  ORF Transcript_21691/g.64605 Transcript_21691/m.64605 type:complete len:345 (+) Transcript_21691:66-1100(+)
MCLGEARAAASPGGRKAMEVRVHGASLCRSFAKVGFMDPYAIVLADGQEVYRTAPDSWSHRQPAWGGSCWVEAGPGPMASAELTVQVWDRNRFHRDVFCGSATVPLQDDAAAEEELPLTKRGETTGTLRVSRSRAAPLWVQPRRDRKESGDVGPPLPSLLGAGTPKSGAKLELLDEDVDDLFVPSEREAEIEAREPQAEIEVRTKPALGLAGEWRCVATDGLDEFLKATGVAPLRRFAAAKARWPTWEFAVSDDRVHFVNHSAMGDLREEIDLSGGYASKDGEGNAFACRAEWEEAADGGVLRIHRSGAKGDFTEERRLSGDSLIFVLRDGKTGISWGRTFQRA